MKSTEKVLKYLFNTFRHQDELLKSQKPLYTVEAVANDSDKVKITWNSVTGASYYRVYQANYADGTKMPLGSWQTSTYYYDYAVNPGTTYYYFVKAATSSSGDNESPYSAPDEGWFIEEDIFPAPTLYPIQLEAYSEIQQIMILMTPL